MGMGNFEGEGYDATPPTTFCLELYENGGTDQDAAWVVMGWLMAFY